MVALTKMPFDSEQERVTDQWTTGRLIDELFINLDNSLETFDSEGTTFTVRKYYDQAEEIIKQFSMTKGEGKLLFVIHLSDLSEKVRKELVDYHSDAGEIAFIILLKQTIRRIFENLDPKYRDNSFMKNLRVKFIE